MERLVRVPELLPLLVGVGIGHPTLGPGALVTLPRIGALDFESVCDKRHRNKSHNFVL